MKKLTVLISSLLLVLLCSGQSKVLPAEEVLKPVYAQAAAQNKKILLMFHASWCGWCHKMDTSLQEKNIKPLINRNYLVTHLTVYEQPDKKDLDNPGALEFLKKHKGTDQGIPFWLILDKNGTELASSIDEQGENSGCPASAKEVEYFIRVLKKTSNLNEEELKIIAKRFRMNEQQPSSTAGR